MTVHTAPEDTLVEHILSLFAREARVDRAVLLPDARADTLGIGSLDLTLALFALEDEFDVQLPDLLSPAGSMPTVGELVRQVQQAVLARRAGPAGAAGPAPMPAPPALSATPDAASLHPVSS